MNRLSHSLLANMFGKGWLSLIGIVAVPFYLHFLGIQAFAIVGLFVALQSLLGVLDLGLGIGFSRELARAGPNAGTAARNRRLFGWLERGYWTAVVLLTVGALAFAPSMGSAWFGDDVPWRVSSDIVYVLMALSLWTQLPQALYLNGLVGLERQVEVNSALGLFATARAGGAILALYLLGPTLVTFFAWQLVVTTTQTLTLAWLFRRYLPKDDLEGLLPGPRTFQQFALFSLGVGSASLVGLVYSQLDRIVLSRLVPLEQLGHYVVAATLASGVYFLAVPVFAATFPRLCRFADSNRAEKHRLHDLATQLIVVFTLPLGLVFTLFPDLVISFWTRDPAVATEAAPFVGPLVAASVCLALGGIHRNYQLAHGLARLPLLQSLGVLAFFAPVLIVATYVFGASGAAWAWLASSLLFLIAAIYTTDRYLEGERTRRWLLVDVVAPAVAIAGVVMAGSLVFVALDAGRWVLSIGLIVVLASLAGTAASADLRKHLEALLSRPPFWRINAP